MIHYRIPQLKLRLGQGPGELEGKITRLLGIDASALSGYVIEKKSIDARDRDNILVVYAILADLVREPPRPIPENLARPCPPPGSYAFPAKPRPGAARPIVVGSGPAGLFCALILAENGFRPLVLERGQAVEARDKSVAVFQESGRLDPESNIQFGEGGAGTYSDGKLNTTVTDENFRNAKILREFVEAGAPEEILYLAKPHIGTDYLVRVVKALRRKIEALGGEVRFDTRVSSLVVKAGRIAGVVARARNSLAEESLASDTVVLAIGHSSRDTLPGLLGLGLEMERKAFALGLRIEHPQEMVSRRQFGQAWRHPDLPVADYKLTHRSAEGRGVYTFCMCPGGRVVNSSSEAAMVTCNGMSDFARDAPNANSAVVVTVHPDDFGGEGPLAGLDFQRRWEGLAFAAGQGGFELPVQTFGDFRAGRVSSAFGEVQPSSLGGHVFADLNTCLPDYVARAIKEGVEAFDRKLRGFARPDAILTGVETRTSSPVRILRGEDFQASIPGLYPCGEGAGYSGGIMSSAIDGIKVAEAIGLSRL